MPPWPPLCGCVCLNLTNEETVMQKLSSERLGCWLMKIGLAFPQASIDIMHFIEVFPNCWSSVRSPISCPTVSELSIFKCSFECPRNVASLLLYNMYNCTIYKCIHTYLSYTIFYDCVTKTVSTLPCALSRSLSLSFWNLGSAGSRMNIPPLNLHCTCFFELFQVFFVHSQNRPEQQYQQRSQEVNGQG